MTQRWGTSVGGAAALTLCATLILATAACTATSPLTDSTTTSPVTTTQPAHTPSPNPRSLPTPTIEPFNPTGGPNEASDWNIDSTSVSGGSFALDDAATRDGLVTAAAFIENMQREAIDRDAWLAGVTPYLRQDMLEALTSSPTTWTQFKWGAEVSPAEATTFDTGRILGVTIHGANADVYVMLTREAADEPWRVAWWE